MPADTSVNFAHWQQVGAPSLAGSAGSMIALLDALLVNGFGLKTIDSLVVSAGVATVTIASGHSAIVNGVQLIAGITGTYAGLNGKQKVTQITTTTFQFDATGFPNGSASGSMTTKVAPLGYSKVFTGTNVAVFKSADVTSLGMFLRVSDPAGNNATVEGYENMTDANTGTGKFASATSSFWPKSSTSDATARPWAIFGDSRGFLLWVEPATTTVSGVTSQGILVGWFDLVPRRSGDQFANTLCVNPSSYVSATTVAMYDMGSMSGSSSNDAWLCPRSQTGIGGAQKQGIYAASRKLILSNSTVSGDGSQTYPNAADNGLDLDEVLMSDFETSSIRGKVPGLYHLPQLVGYAFQTFDQMDGSGDLSGRKIMFMRLGSPGYNVQNFTNGRVGVVAIDITGPWR